MVVADTRAEAEDAAELVAVEWEPLPAVADQLQAIAPGAPVIHHTLGDNVAFDFTIEKGNPAKAFAEADVVIEEELRFERQMAMPLEARGLIADFNPGDGSLTVIHSHQSPFQMQHIFSRHLGIPEHQVRVVAPDVGGGFGLKVNVHVDEVATAVASMLLRRPVKFCVDRLESFVADTHSRDHRIKCRIAVEQVRRDPGHGGGRHRCGRRLRHAAAVQCRRGHDDNRRDRGALSVRELQGAHAQRLREQEPDRHVSRRRHAARLLRDRAPHRSRRRKARHRHGGVQAAGLLGKVVIAMRHARWLPARWRVVP